jgi:hypothetical protein
LDRNYLNRICICILICTASVLRNHQYCIDVPWYEVCRHSYT